MQTRSFAPAGLRGSNAWLHAQVQNGDSKGSEGVRARITCCREQSATWRLLEDHTLLLLFVANGRLLKISESISCFLLDTMHPTGRVPHRSERCHGEMRQCAHSWIRQDVLLGSFQDPDSLLVSYYAHQPLRHDFRSQPRGSCQAYAKRRFCKHLIL